MFIDIYKYIYIYICNQHLMDEFDVTEVMGIGSGYDPKWTLFSHNILYVTSIWSKWGKNRTREFPLRRSTWRWPGLDISALFVSPSKTTVPSIPVEDEVTAIRFHQTWQLNILSKWGSQYKNGKIIYKFQYEWWTIQKVEVYSGHHDGCSQVRALQPVRVLGLGQAGMLLYKHLKKWGTQVVMISKWCSKWFHGMNPTKKTYYVSVLNNFTVDS